MNEFLNAIRKRQENNIQNLLDKVTELNERVKLLKECRKFILDLFGLPYGFNKDVSAKDILTKINEVMK